MADMARLELESGIDVLLLETGDALLLEYAVRLQILAIITSQYRNIEAITSQYRSLDIVEAQSREVEAITAQSRQVQSVTTQQREVEVVTSGG